MNLAYAQKLNPDGIYILSAKYRLMELEDEIAPYDVTLNSMRTSQIKEWASRVIKQLKAKADLENDKFILHTELTHIIYLPQPFQRLDRVINGQLFLP